MKKHAISQWLEREYLRWQLEEGRRGTIGDFAEWLGVSRNTYNNWATRGRPPSRKHVELLAEKLGEDIFDIVGLPRPDPRLHTIIDNWGKLADPVCNLLTGAVNGPETLQNILEAIAQLDDDDLGELNTWLESRQPPAK